MDLCSRVVGCGGYLPSKIVTNQDLEKTLDTTDEWIQSRTGIKQRYIALDNELTSHLAIRAAEKALASSSLTTDDIDCIIVATTTPDDTFPSTAVKVQHKLGMKKGFAFDIQAVCSGFVYALATADNFIRSNHVKTALVIGAETISRILDWQDRSTAILFGDGAGALILKSASFERPTGILSTHLFSDGAFRDFLYVDGGPSQDSRKVGFLRMRGYEVMKHAIDKIGQAVEYALHYNQLSHEDIDWFVPHQANKNIIEGVARRFHLPLEKIIMTIENHANTSAASIPLALYEGVKDGRIQKGHLIVIEAMGAGFTWGSAVIRW